ncbi:MAG: large conductance mechanosensitive channel protein MscL [Fimbriimonadaceae bacterium]|nr:large conductance mechanosensitive channel protein MscL [Fimbriimonadaceae bacterium]
MLKELKAFLLRGNVVDLAVGVVIGAAFSAITNSLVADIITPLIGAIFGKPDFSALVIQLGQDADGKPKGIMVGNFLNAVVNFLIVGTALFFVIKAMNRLFPPPAPAPAGPTDVDLLTEIRDLLKKEA